MNESTSESIIANHVSANDQGTVFRIPRIKQKYSFKKYSVLI